MIESLDREKGMGVFVMNTPFHSIKSQKEKFNDWREKNIPLSNETFPVFKDFNTLKKEISKIGSLWLESFEILTNIERSGKYRETLRDYFRILLRKNRVTLYTSKETYPPHYWVFETRKEKLILSHPKDIFKNEEEYLKLLTKEFDEKYGKSNNKI